MWYTKLFYIILDIILFMKEFNDEKKKEIRIKQDRLKTLIDIESLCDSIPGNEFSDDKRNSILEYSSNEKNKLVIDIINMCNIHELDDWYTEERTFATRLTVESTVSSCLNFTDLNRYTSDKVLKIILDDFMFILANYDIEEIVNLDVLVNYLKLIKDVSSDFDEINDVTVGLKKNT